ncbi:Gfo/Idh/MocA family protein [Bosea lathyri]|uniref:Predicted dehydrogenase n=1 Tax=Bosea lathyri TaxID=1036778 RepID=A0A1H6D9V0_9HYPH|nr:Gfo/Idh/MocA family oxidoreductase [Bosea lathyri]SEG81465.1 Predicted dehydrogenase [Bosea lathyri]
MSQLPELPLLRIGLIGSGFIAAFHLQSMLGVRNVAVCGVYSRSHERRTRLAQKARDLGLGPAHVFDSVEAMAMSGEVDALWLLTPNDTRLDIMREIHRLTKAGAPIRAIACEKPLARTLAEAREMLALAEDAGLLHGYLENQLFSTAVMRGKDIIWRRAVPQGGRPYLARAAEEHSGPHEPWFWQGERQGGGVLSDMMCHSVEVARFMLTAPGAARDTLKLVSASATTANLKWTRPRYAADLKARMGIDFARRPVEDFARGILTLEDADGHQLMIEATTSWAYVGAGLRIQLELLGPEYSMEFSSLSTGLKVFLSRHVTGSEGEDLVEKQNAEQGLMPVIEDEAGVYGYTDENRHMVEAFRRGLQPAETFHDGVGVMEMLMGLYRSAELGRTVMFPDAELESYVPVVARP